jgi:hypothetical protein
LVDHVAGNGGTVYGDGTASVTQQFISVNAYGYWEYEVSAIGLNVGLNAGTYSTRQFVKGANSEGKS